jgi:hypothetical protein
MPYDSNILRFTAPINKINDAVAGDSSAVFSGLQSRFVGQLGAGFWRDENQIIYNSTMGTVLAGHFRYVRLATGATAVVVGQIVFWDTLANAVENLYQVTTVESGSTDAAMKRAGIVLNSGWTAGNYSVVQDVGICFVKFRGTLTAAGAAGSRVYCAAAGGADLGFADVVDSGAAAAISDVSKMAGRFIGIAEDTPTNAGLKRVDLQFANVRG